MAVFRLSGYRRLLKLQITERQYDYSKLTPEEPTKIVWEAKRTSREHLNVNAIISETDPDSAMKYLASKAMVQVESSPLDLLPVLNGTDRFAEYLYILRPLFYGWNFYNIVLAIRKYGQNSYIPWFMSLGTEVACLLQSLNVNVMTSMLRYKPSISDLEKDELKRRRLLLFYYLLRKPFYTDFTKY